jgi:septal ring factor EnvC (AmiA/AmiB activator)
VRPRRRSTQAELEQVDVELRDAERILSTVTSAVGTVREQMARTALKLNVVDRKSARLSQVLEDIGHTPDRSQSVERGGARRLRADVLAW